MTITWQVDTMDVTYTEGSLSDVVTSVAWRAIATDGTFVDPDGTTRPLSATTIGSVEVTPPDPDSFTPYADITETQAVGWAKDALGNEKVLEIEADVTAAVEQKKTPTSGTPELPWSSEADGG
tara:strand:- start:628 stop:996 length:369 start_codon:yes stop_codon:yes gene_type:complete